MSSHTDVLPVPSFTFPSAQSGQGTVGVSQLASVYVVECGGGGQRHACCTLQIKVEPEQAAWNWLLPCINPAATQ